MPHAPLLKNEDPPQLRLNIKIFLLRCAADASLAPFDAFVTEVNLDCNSRLPAIWKVQLAIIMTFEEMPSAITEKAESFINTLMI